jgi:hypothetical protein
MAFHAGTDARHQEPTLRSPVLLAPFVVVGEGGFGVGKPASRVLNVWNGKRRPWGPPYFGYVDLAAAVQGFEGAVGRDRTLAMEAPEVGF